MKIVCQVEPVDPLRNQRNCRTMWKQGGSRSSALDRAMAQLAAKKVASAGGDSLNVSRPNSFSVCISVCVCCQKQRNLVKNCRTKTLCMTSTITKRWM